jgi:hypothetical protein
MVSFCYLDENSALSCVSLAMWGKITASKVNFDPGKWLTSVKVIKD